MQIAIACPFWLLLASASSVRATATSVLGFESGLLYAAPLDLNAGPQTDNTAAMDFRVRSLRDDLAKVSGIASATVADGLPLDFEAAQRQYRFDGSDGCYGRASAFK